MLGAQTQGMIGYWLLQALGNALPGREVACLVCRTLVAAGDPAFSSPAKFVGPGGNTVLPGRSGRYARADRQARRSPVSWHA